MKMSDLRKKLKEAHAGTRFRSPTKRLYIYGENAEEVLQELMKLAREKATDENNS